MPIRILFLCTANSARSILFAATLNHLGKARFEAHSAGSQPAGVVNPSALAELQRRGIPAEGARSKSWDEYADPEAVGFDVVITVCDSAANESCPVFFGDFVKAHWPLPDPAAIQGDAALVQAAFRRTEDVIVARIQALVALPMETMSRDALRQELAAIDARFPAMPLTECAA